MNRIRRLLALSVVLYTTIASAVTWSPIGPSPELTSSFGPVSGRVLCIAVIPAYSSNGLTKPAAMLIAPEGGGLWTSHDFESNAPTWTPVADNLLPGAKTIHTLAVSTKSPGLVFAGADGGFLMYSLDGGDHWASIESETTASIQKIIVDPVTDRIFFATDYISDDTNTVGGIFLWSPFAGVSRVTTGLSNTTTVLSDFDFTLDPSGKITLFVALNGNGDPTASSVAGIWSYTDIVGKWQQMSVSLFDLSSQTTVSHTARGQILFGADHTVGSPNGIYAGIANQTSATLLNVYKLGGQSWNAIGGPIKKLPIQTTSATFVFGLSDLGAAYLSLGNTQQQVFYQTVDGGATWVDVRTGGSGPTPHVDQHSFASYDGNVYVGNDGGIYRFTPLANRKAGPSLWTGMNSSSLQTILVNGVGAHPTKSGVALVGSQDNSIALLEQGEWSYVTGNDNSKVVFDPDPSQQGKYAYTTGVSEYLFLLRSDDEGKTWSDKSPPDADDADGHQAANIGWYTPFDLHPANTQRIVVGIDRVYESTNRGEPNSWGKQKSPIFKPIGMRSDGRPYGSTSTAIAYGQNDQIWVAYGQSIYLTTNDGGDGTSANWNDMSAGTNFGADIVQIRVDPVSPSNVYLATANKIWESTIAVTLTGIIRGWRDITADLPASIGYQTLLVEDSDVVGRPVLLVGTGAGVYVSFDRGGSWGTLNNGLPASTVNDMNYAAVTHTLLAGMYGRGVFQSSIDSLLTITDQPNVQVRRWKSSNCDVVPVEGETVEFSYVVKNPLDDQGWTATWQAPGASLAPGTTWSDSKLRIVIANSKTPVTVTVDIQFADGLKASSSLTFVPIPGRIAAFQAWLCQMGNIRERPIPFWEWDPNLWQWDNQLHSIRLQPNTKSRLLEQEAVLQQRLKDIQTAIRRSR